MLSEEIRAILASSQPHGWVLEPEAKRLLAETRNLFNNARLVFQKAEPVSKGGSLVLREKQADYDVDGQ